MIKVKHPLALLPMFFLITTGCAPGGEQKSNQSVKFQQYFVAGQTLYEARCSNCHQSDGTGLGRLYPPLKQVDYLSKGTAEIACLIKFGKQGPILVNGVMYNQEMKGIPELTNLEIAEIITYVYNSWGNSLGLVDVSEVDNLLLSCNVPK